MWYTYVPYRGNLRTYIYKKMTTDGIGCCKFIVILSLSNFKFLNINRYGSEIQLTYVYCISFEVTANTVYSYSK